jgi:predicted phage-related endonuclease
MALPRTVLRVRELLAAQYAEQRSEEWLELRENMITASDVASAIGENHYETPESFIKKKVQLIKLTIKNIIYFNLQK